MNNKKLTVNYEKLEGLINSYIKDVNPDLVEIMLETTRKFKKAGYNEMELAHFAMVIECAYSDCE